MFGAIGYHFDGLRVTAVGDIENVTLAFRQSMAHGHGFGRGSGLVQYRSVGEFHSGQIADHGLEIEQRLEAPLRDFGLGDFRLVRGIGGVPGGITQQVTLDDRGRVGIVITHPDK